MYRIMRLPMTWKPVTPYPQLQPYEGFPAQLCEPGRGPPVRAGTRFAGRSDVRPLWNKFYTSDFRIKGSQVEERNGISAICRDQVL